MNHRLCGEGMEAHRGMPLKSVSTGQEVKAGDKLATLEAMKMLTTVSASADGTIAEVLVLKGDRVESDDLLVKITVV